MPWSLPSRERILRFSLVATAVAATLFSLTDASEKIGSDDNATLTCPPLPNPLLPLLAETTPLLESLATQALFSLMEHIINLSSTPGGSMLIAAKAAAQEPTHHFRAQEWLEQSEAKPTAKTLPPPSGLFALKEALEQWQTRHTTLLNRPEIAYCLNTLFQRAAAWAIYDDIRHGRLKLEALPVRHQAFLWAGAKTLRSEVVYLGHLQQYNGKDLWLAMTGIPAGVDLAAQGSTTIEQLMAQLKHDHPGCTLQSLESADLMIDWSQASEFTLYPFSYPTGRVPESLTDLILEYDRLLPKPSSHKAQAQKQKKLALAFLRYYAQNDQKPHTPSSASR